MSNNSLNVGAQGQTTGASSNCYQDHAEQKQQGKQVLKMPLPRVPVLQLLTEKNAEQNRQNIDQMTNRPKVRGLRPFSVSVWNNGGKTSNDNTPKSAKQINNKGNMQNEFKNEPSMNPVAHTSRHFAKQTLAQIYGEYNQQIAAIKAQNGKLTVQQTSPKQGQQQSARNWKQEKYVPIRHCNTARGEQSYQLTKFSMQEVERLITNQQMHSNQKAVMIRLPQLSQKKNVGLTSNCAARPQINAQQPTTELKYLHTGPKDDRRSNEQQNIEILYMDALCFYAGYKQPQDDAKAVATMRDAAVAGYPEAMKALFWWQADEKMKIDIQKVADEFKALANEANPSLSELYRYGECLRLGIGMHKDLAEAMKQFVRAVGIKQADKGHRMSAINSYALCLWELQGSKIQRQEAFNLLKNAADLGNMEASLFVAHYHLTSRIESTKHEGLSFLKKAAASGNATGLLELGNYYTQGQYIKRSLAIAAKYHFQAVSRGCLQAVEQLQICDLKEYDKEKLPFVFAICQRAASGGNTNALFNVGICYKLGICVARDNEMASKQLQEAVKGKHFRAMVSLGNMYENGFGVKQDHQKALQLYRQAAEADVVSNTSNHGNRNRYCIGISKDLEKVQQCLQKASIINPANAVQLSKVEGREEEEATKPLEGSSNRLDGQATTPNEDDDMQIEQSKNKVNYQSETEQSGNKGDFSITGIEIAVADQSASVGLSPFSTYQDDYGLLIHQKSENDFQNEDSKAIIKFPEVQDQNSQDIPFQDNSDKEAALNSADAHTMQSLEVNEKELLKQRFEALKQKSATGGADVQLELGMCYLEAHGVDQNYDQAISYFKQAADAGNATAKAQLGRCYLNGWGANKDMQNGLQLIRKAAQLSNPELLAVSGENKLKENLASYDGQQAIERLKKAADIGSTEALNWLKGCAERKVGCFWLQRVFECFDDTCEIKEFSARNAGFCYLHGVGVEPDKTKAVEMLKIAADGGDEYAANLIRSIDHVAANGHSSKQQRPAEALHQHQQQASFNGVQSMQTGDNSRESDISPLAQILTQNLGTNCETPVFLDAHNQAEQSLINKIVQNRVADRSSL